MEDNAPDRDDVVSLLTTSLSQLQPWAGDHADHDLFDRIRDAASHV